MAVVLLQPALPNVENERLWLPGPLESAKKTQGGPDTPGPAHSPATGPVLRSKVCPGQSVGVGGSRPPSR